VDARFPSRAGAVPNEPQSMAAAMDALAEAASLRDAGHSLALPRDRWLVAASAGAEADSRRAAMVERAHLPPGSRTAAFPVSLCEHSAQQLAAVQKKPAELVAVSPRRPAGSLPQQTV